MWMDSGAAPQQGGKRIQISSEVLDIETSNAA